MTGDFTFCGNRDCPVACARKNIPEGLVRYSFSIFDFEVVENSIIRTLIEAVGLPDGKLIRCEFYIPEKE